MSMTDCAEKTTAGDEHLDSGGPLAGEREIVAWPKLSPASHRIPAHVKEPCLLNLIMIGAFAMSSPRLKT
jgi:hypothetical protein